MRRSWVMAVCAAGLLAPGSAVAAGGPVPPVQGGRASASTAAGALRRGAADGNTRVERVAAPVGAVERRAPYRRPLRRPGRRLRRLDDRALRRRSTLVLARITKHYPPKSPACSWSTRRPSPCASASRLPGFIAVDAISPDGRRSTPCATAARASSRTTSCALDVQSGQLAEDADHGPARARREDGRRPAGADDEPRRPLGLHALHRRGELRPRAGHAKGEARCIDLPAGDLSARTAATRRRSTLHVGASRRSTCRRSRSRRPPRTGPHSHARARPRHSAPAKNDGWRPLAAVRARRRRSRGLGCSRAGCARTPPRSRSTSWGTTWTPTNREKATR